MIQSKHLQDLLTGINENDHKKVSYLLDNHIYAGNGVLWINDELKNINALMYAATINQVNIMPLLIEKGAGINKMDTSGWTALAYACRYGQIEAAQWLIDKGAKVDLRDLTKDRPIYNCHIKCLPLLIKANADIHSFSGGEKAPVLFFEDTPLMHYVAKNNHAAVRLLLDAGVDIHVKDARDRDVLYHAAMSNAVSCLPLLLEHGASLASLEQHAEYKNYLQTVPDNRLREFFSIIHAHREQSTLESRIVKYTPSTETRFSF